LLLVAAALLTVSMHSLRVVETPDALQVAPVAEAVHAPPPHAPDPALAHGRAFLDGLADATPVALQSMQDDARVLATALDDPPAAVQVGSWWSALDERERAVLERNAPVVVGNLDGVPYDVRDRANRSALAAGRADTSEAHPVAAMYGQVRTSLEQQPGDPVKTLVTLDPRAGGRAAVAIGDLDTASDVTMIVPGMFFTVTGQLVDFTATAGDLYREQATLAPVAAPAPGSGIAVVAWMGYQTPNLSNVLSLDLAHTGARRLERAVAGLREVRAGHEPRLGVIAHSYGSTTALLALSSGRMHADSLTLLGSPGSRVATVGQLAVPDDQVFVGGAHGDPVAGSGYFGVDPGASGFGARLLDLTSADVGAAGELFRRPQGHNDYLKPGTASLHDAALIAVGRGDLVRDARHGRGGRGDGLVPASPDMYLVRPQDLQPRE
jgi:hypothetical protein